MRTLLASLLALAACSNGGGVPSGDDGSGGGGGGGGDEAAQIQQDYDDVAAAVGVNINTGELAAMVDAVNMAYGRLPAGFVEDPPGSLTGSRGGLSVQYKFYCRDDADAVTPCDGAENHEHVRVQYSGSISSASGAVDGLTRDGAWIVRDVATPTPRVGGEGTIAFAAMMATGSYEISVMDTFGHVLFEAASPLVPIGGGTMDLMLTVHRTRDAVGDRDFAIAAHIDFTGRDAAIINLDGVHTYDLTVSTGVVVRVD
jgi:hypothetical protein